MDEIITLQQQMDKLAADEIVHIGSKSGFFFCGTKAEYEADIDTISEQILSGMKEELRQIKTFKTRFHNNFTKLTEFDPETEDEDVLKKMARAALIVSNAAEKKARNNRRRPILEQNLAAFKPVRERIVLDFYHRTAEDGVNIIVEGCEEGRFWTLDEYRNGVSNEQHTVWMEDDDG